MLPGSYRYSLTFDHLKNTCLNSCLIPFHVPSNLKNQFINVKCTNDDFVDINNAFNLFNQILPEISNSLNDNYPSPKFGPNELNGTFKDHLYGSPLFFRRLFQFSNINDPYAKSPEIKICVYNNSICARLSMKPIFTPKEKSEIVKQHFLKAIPIEAICKKYQITPLIFEKWKNNLFENSDLVFKQTPDDGMDYYQNYDLVINWLSQAFKGQTLSVLGIETAPIKRVCSFKPVEIAINTGVVDVIFEDENEKSYHLEEQRHMTESDLYRFAAQHFSVAKEWRDDVIDIILISGRPYNGKRIIKTQSGLYQPTFVDLTERNGKERLKQIREAVESGDTSSLLELAFLPMYGNNDDVDNKEFVKDIIRFETELFKKDRTKELLIAATLIMSNKILDTETFDKLWKEIKMIKAFVFAEEKGYDRGMNEGFDKGALATAKTMLIEALEETIGVVPEYIEKKIQQISSQTALKGLFRQAMRCNDIKDFDQKLALAIS